MPSLTFLLFVTTPTCAAYVLAPFAFRSRLRPLRTSQPIAVVDAAYVPTPFALRSPLRPLRTAQPIAVVDAAPVVAIADAAGTGGILDQIVIWQNSHALLYAILSTILVRYLIGELRSRIEKPVLDEAGRRVSSAVEANLTPDRTEIKASAWAKLALCVALDLAGDASELIPILGEATDLGFAPVEAGMIKLLFQSNLLAGLGFLEEILPFTDVVPTFTISWCLQHLWPTTKLAKKLMPDAVAAKS